MLHHVLVHLFKLLLCHDSVRCDNPLVHKRVYSWSADARSRRVMDERRCGTELCPRGRWVREVGYVEVVFVFSRVIGIEYSLNVEVLLQLGCSLIIDLVVASAEMLPS